MLESYGSISDEETKDAVWPAFGDLMACLFGIFVLFFVWGISFQADLTRDLQAERTTRELEEKRRHELEDLLAHSLGADMHGKVTLSDGKIGIGGSVLFQSSSAELQPDGAVLLSQLAGPLGTYLGTHDQVLMVSGFTDDQPVRDGSRHFKDNWELSAQRALTVMRSLLAAGIPQERIFAAGFGETRPLFPNRSDDQRAKNRRVEMAPLARP